MQLYSHGGKSNVSPCHLRKSQHAASWFLPLGLSSAAATSVSVLGAATTLTPALLRPWVRAALGGALYEVISNVFPHVCRELGKQGQVDLGHRNFHFFLQVSAVFLAYLGAIGENLLSCPVQLLVVSCISGLWLPSIFKASKSQHVCLTFH